MRNDSKPTLSVSLHQPIREASYTCAYVVAAYGTLTPEHTKLLTQFFHRHHSQFAEATFAMKWALLSWNTETAA